MKKYITAADKYVGSTVVYVGHPDDDPLYFAFKDAELTKPFSPEELECAFYNTQIVFRDGSEEHESTYYPCTAMLPRSGEFDNVCVELSHIEPDISGLDATLHTLYALVETLPPMITGMEMVPVDFNDMVKNIDITMVPS